MPGENHSKVSFDERAALAELERLQRSIQEYRRRREHAEGEFEQFVGSFRTPAGSDHAAPDSSRAPLPGFYTAPVTSPPAPAPALAPAPQAAPVPPPPAGIAETASFTVETSRAEVNAAVAGVTRVGGADPFVVPPPAVAPPPAVTLPDDFFSRNPRAVATENAPAQATAPEARKRPGRGWLPLVLGVAAAVLLAILLLPRFRTAQVAPPPAPIAVEETPAAAPPAAPPAAAPATAATQPVSAPAPAAELRTTRRVWVRVIVDGNREVEREVEADAHVPLPAGRTFVVRAGDAGAVRLLLNGEDQGPLGADAQVVTRTFTRPAR
jgi:hypothetical protein